MSHLHAHKASMSWTKHVPEYDGMPRFFQAEVEQSFEAAYGSVLGRCWMEVRKLWLEYITYSHTSILREAGHVFFRDEYQSKDLGAGNLSHIHGMVAIKQKDMDNEAFCEHIYSL